MESEIGNAVIDIRRLVYNLRPPTLDEMGLLDAIKELGRVSSGGYKAFQVEVRTPSSLPSLDAALEVALYRIVQEALHNVARHSNATIVWISILFSDRVELEVMDNGMGLKKTLHKGVGLNSMRERAEELGGSCTVDNVGNGKTGTRVYAQIPIMNVG
jgi:two-component system NarL family sensor kinase